VNLLLDTGLYRREPPQTWSRSEGDLRYEGFFYLYDGQDLYREWPAIQVVTGLEILSIKTAPKEFKLELLKALGLGVDDKEIYVIKDGKPVVDDYVNKPVRFDNMAIFPGSTVVLDDNPLSIASYIEDHPEAS
jgi:hypothetical protein